jgi:hypothetical protein
MAKDGVFFSAVGTLNPKSRVPVVAILSAGRMGGGHRDDGPVRSNPQLRRGDRRVVLRAHRGVAVDLSLSERREGGSPTGRIKVPLHPITTSLFVIACWSVSVVTIIHRPAERRCWARHSFDRRNSVQVLAAPRQEREALRARVSWSGTSLAQWMSTPALALERF